jgi:hypothetical protein
MSLYRYSLFGVCFTSDIALELPEPLVGVPPRFDLRAATGPWPPADGATVVQEDSDDWIALRALSDGSLEIEWKEWLALWIEPRGRYVHYRHAGARYPTAFEAYVANFAISAALLLQGEETLHATVVAYRGAGLGFLGHSGAGKSTMTASLLARGAELVTDDMLRLTERDGKLWAEPGQPRLKLFKETALRYLPSMIDRGRWNPVSEKFLFDVSDPTELRAPRVLDALLLLAPPEDRDKPEIAIRRLGGLELFQTLTSSTMHRRMQTEDRLARQFAYAAHLSGKLPVYKLCYPRLHDLLPDVISILEEAVLSKCRAS